MSDKLPMTRVMISEEMSKIDPISRWAILLFAEHILRIGTTELREENKRLRSGEFICKKCGLRKDADNFFEEGSIPF